jgi:hypothetical protein
MPVKRVPLGLTWEQHLQFAARLRDLWELVYSPNRDKTKMLLCSKLFALNRDLAFEMAEYVYLDCKGTSYVPTRDDPYDGWRFSEAKFEHSFADIRTNLINLREALLPTNPKGKAVSLIGKMLAAMNKAGV